MDAKELRQRSADELRRSEHELRAEAQSLAFKAATRALKTTGTPRANRKQLARVLTVAAEQRRNRV